MIGRLSQDEKANWPKHLPELIQAYNGMRSAITGYSLHYLLFGYHLRFPIDLHLPTIWKRHVVHGDFVVMLQQHLSEVLNEVCRQNVLEAHWQKWYYDCRSSTVVLKPGDVVLLKMDSYTGRRKTKKQVELQELYSPASTRPGYFDLWDTGWRWINLHCSLELTIPPAS